MKACPHEFFALGLQYRAVVIEACIGLRQIQQITGDRRGTELADRSAQDAREEGQLQAEPLLLGIREQLGPNPLRFETDRPRGGLRDSRPRSGLPLTV